MKKIIISIIAVAIILGAGLTVKNSTDRAGEPPIGGSPQVVAMTVHPIAVHPMGEPPIGG